MSKGKKKSSILASRFYRIYFAVVAAALVLIAIGLFWLNGVVRDYEIAQPVHAAEEVARLFEAADYDRLYEYDTSAQDISGGDRDFYVQSLRAIAGGKAVDWQEAYSANPNEKKYSVTLDGDKLAVFTLVPSGKTTGHGNTLWQLGSVTTNVVLRDAEPAVDAAQAPYRISAPSTYTVTVNGEPLTQKNVVSTDGEILPAGFTPSEVTVPTMTEYAFYSEGGAPESAVTDETGAAAEVHEDGENTWKCELKENAQLREQYGQAVINLAERVAKYTVKDLSRSAMLGNVLSDSPAEEILKNFSNSWAPSHKTAKVTDAKVTDFYVLSDSCFTCHVEFTFTLTTRRGNDYVYPTSYTFCVVRHKGAGKLYNITFN